MRIGRFLGVLVCVGGTVLAAGCSSGHAPAGAGQRVSVAAAISRTQDQTARIAVTTGVAKPGMSVSYTETGEYDFARSRGTISQQTPINVTQVFVPMMTYIKVTGLTGTGDGSGASGLPKGKTWLAVPNGTAGWLTVLADDGAADPAGPLAALSTVSSSVKKLGPSVIRGVPVTGYSLTIDMAKVATVPATDRAEVEGLLNSAGDTTLPVDVWVDGHNEVRREKLTLSLLGGSRAPGGVTLTLTTDFYDFGVPVRVSAPPASLVDTDASGFGSPASAGSGSAAASPPPPSGTLTPGQATAAERAVTAFWAALGRDNASAVAATVVPSQRSCVRSNLGPDSGAPTITVSGLHITSAEPAGDAGATVRFTVKATASLDGQNVPVLPSGPGSTQWLATTEVAGRWYVNITNSSALAFGGSGACN